MSGPKNIEGVGIDGKSRESPALGGGGEALDTDANFGSTDPGSYQIVILVKA